MPTPQPSPKPTRKVEILGDGQRASAAGARSEASQAAVLLEEKHTRRPYVANATKPRTLQTCSIIRTLEYNSISEPSPVNFLFAVFR